jgi:hypothetical protein
LPNAIKKEMMTNDDYYITKIAEYKAKRDSSCWADSVVQYVLEQEDIGNAIIKAVMSRAKNEKKHSHQWRLPNKVLENYSQILLKEKEEIEKIKSFDELFYLLDSLKIHGVGELLVYDASVRVGYFQKLFPQKIYIHAGTRIGLERFLKRKIYGNTLEKQQLPEPFRSCDLTPGQLEDFFCINKDIFLVDNEKVILRKNITKKWC